jgi:hypothetical protein
LTEAFTPWAQALTPDEAGVLRDYKNLMWRDINRMLRGREDLPGQRPAADALNAALQRGVMPQSVRVHRSINEAEAAFYRSVPVGGTVVNPGFVSTSLEREKIGKDFPRAEIVEIVVPAGHRGVAYVHPFPSVQHHQYELLLAAGTSFKVLNDEAGGLVLEVTDGDGDGDG